MKQKVSIIVPLYNGKKYIDGICNSVVDNVQFCESENKAVEAELIFVNDYPEERIEEKDIVFRGLDIKIINNDCNKGIHETRVVGLENSCGEYVLFLDQDDNISYNYLESQLSAIKDYDAVLCNGYYRSRKKIYDCAEEQIKAITYRNYLKHEIVIISPGQVLLRREAIPEIWKNIILKQNGSDDVFLWIMMLKQSCKFTCNTECLYTHVEDGLNTSSNFKNMKKSITELYDVLNKNHILPEDEFAIFENSVRRRVEKYDGYIEIIDKWDEIVEKLLNNISDEDKKIGIYGYGIIGKKLYNSLVCRGVKIDVVMDANASHYDCDIDIMRLSDLDEFPDIVINTVTFVPGMDNIIKEKIPKCKVYSLDKL